MNHLLQHGILLAQRSRLEGMAGGFQGRRARIDGSDIVLGLLVLGGIVLAVWLLSYLLSLQERRKGLSSAGLLFLSLCKAHRLRWTERWLLWRLARSQRLRDPTQLFLEPERFEPIHLPPPLRLRAGQLIEIRDRLFAGLEDEEAESESSADAPEAQSQQESPGAEPLAPPVGAAALNVAPLSPTAGNAGGKN